MDIFRNMIGWVAKPARFGNEATRGDTLKVPLRALGDMAVRQIGWGSPCVVQGSLWPCAQPLGSRPWRCVAARYGAALLAHGHP